MDDLFSLFYTGHFLCEYLINTSGNLCADTMKIIKMHWMDDYQLLEKDSDGSVSLSSFDLLQVLGPRSAGADWVRFHEHN